MPSSGSLEGTLIDTSVGVGIILIELEPCPTLAAAFCVISELMTSVSVGTGSSLVAVYYNMNINSRYVPVFCLFNTRIMNKHSLQ